MYSVHINFQDKQMERKDNEETWKEQSRNQRSSELHEWRIVWPSRTWNDASEAELGLRH